MIRSARTWLVATAFAATVSLSGCLKMTQSYTLYPDGSGKCDVKMTFMGMMANMMKMAKQMGPDAMGPGGEKPEDPRDAVKNALKGKVYWDTIEEKDTEAETYTITGTGYFENVADVVLEDGPINFGPDGDGFKFSMKQKGDLGEGMPGMPGMPGGEEGQDPNSPEAQQMKAMMKGMMAGFEVKISVQLPGAVKAVEGFSGQEGRVAFFKIGEEEFGKIMDKQLKLPELLTATSGPADAGLQAEWDAFKTKLAEVKAKSLAAQAEAEKKAAEEAKKAEEEAKKAPEGEQKPNEGGGF